MVTRNLLYFYSSFLLGASSSLPLHPSNRRLKTTVLNPTRKSLFGELTQESSSAIWQVDFNTSGSFYLKPIGAMYQSLIDKYLQSTSKNHWFHALLGFLKPKESNPRRACKVVVDNLTIHIFQWRQEEVTLPKYTFSPQPLIQGYLRLHYQVKEKEILPTLVDLIAPFLYAKSLRASMAYLDMHETGERGGKGTYFVQVPHNKAVDIRSYPKDLKSPFYTLYDADIAEYLCTAFIFGRLRYENKKRFSFACPGLSQRRDKQSDEVPVKRVTFRVDSDQASFAKSTSITIREKIWHSSKQQTILQVVLCCFMIAPRSS